jgi:hypothetical protein
LPFLFDIPVSWRVAIGDVRLIALGSRWGLPPMLHNIPPCNFFVDTSMPTEHWRLSVFKDTSEQGLLA